MSAFLLALVLGAQAGAAPVERDGFGVPHVRADTNEAAMREFGRAVAQDRLWQMENSRRLARGRMAEAFGEAYFASDREVALTGYTDAELEQQFARLPERVRGYFLAYAEGVNHWIEEAKAGGRLPAEYARFGLVPEPWSPLDSVAISVRMAQMFGSGGGGELRNLAALQYLRTTAVKDRALDAFDDLLWSNDPRAMTTVSAKEDPLAKTHPIFPKWSRSDTERQLKAMPQPGLLELLPAVRLLAGEDTTFAAEQTATPFKWGSYAVVVGKDRSKTGRPWLLSAPQMGHTIPSIVHEVSLSTPDWKVAGMDVPGIPAVLIGHTDKLAWGLTTGVADLADVFWFADLGEGKYQTAKGPEAVKTIERTILVKGGAPRTVVTLRTTHGPVILHSRGAKAYFAKKTSYWMREMDAFGSIYDLYRAAEPAEVRAFAAKVPVCFNLFYATTSGHTGWQYCGWVPTRRDGFDPRLPLPGDGTGEWTGAIPFEKMPHVVDPPSGLIANWNNKPVAWWPNLDTPVWGRIFRNEVLLEQLTAPKLGPSDIERAAWSIARRDPNAKYFVPVFRTAIPDGGEAGTYLKGYDGWRLDGLAAPVVFDRTLAGLRRYVFGDKLGTFVNPEFFSQAIQPSLILAAWNKETKIDYMEGKSRDLSSPLRDWTTGGDLPSEVSEWRLSMGSFAAPEGPRVAYADRGTYIQIVELTPRRPVGRNVVPPGVAETGSHADDQVALARQWTFKPMGYRG
ncbi:MAG: penicillin acylase family protein [Fimbriimonadaceae bacterium]|nr:penicillin acylase family protein [Fimbriimonadaceae bacterium]